MIINVTDKYYLKVDERQFAVVERTGRVHETGKQEGKPIERTLSYPTKLEHALSFIARITLLDEHTELTLDEYLRELQLITDKLVRACKGVPDEL